MEQWKVIRMDDRWCVVWFYPRMDRWYVKRRFRSRWRANRLAARRQRQYERDRNWWPERQASLHRTDALIRKILKGQP